MALCAFYKLLVKNLLRVKLLGLYPDFEFSSNDGDVSVDALGDASIQSSCLGFIIFFVERFCIYRIFC